MGLLTAAKRAAFAVALSVWIGAAAGASACLEDLAPPATCPPPATVEAKSCIDVFYREEPGCISFQEGGLEQLACLTGPRTTCDCLPDECPASDDACFPHTNCPDAVVAAAGGDVTCPKLESADFAPVERIVQASQCVCGCFACAAVCDGKGPVFGTVDDGSPVTYVAPIIGIADRMPDAGTLGLYLRARGFSNGGLYVVVGPILDLPPGKMIEIVATYYLSTAPDTFGEMLLSGDDNLVVGGKGQPYRWETPDRKPTFLVLVPPEADAPPAVQSLWELDCVIPYVTPP